MKPTARILLALILHPSSLILSAEVWLTPERAASLRRLAARPYITGQQSLPDGTVVYTWTNRLQNAVTTQRVARVLGKPARNAWQEKLDAKEREKKALLGDVKALGDKPAKKTLDALIEKHSK